ncbi:hypothetical protein MXB_4930, partial [Myxobolus squamalis]
MVVMEDYLSVYINNVWKMEYHHSFLILIVHELILRGNESKFLLAIIKLDLCQFLSMLVQTYFSFRVLDSVYINHIVLAVKYSFYKTLHIIVKIK